MTWQSKNSKYVAGFESNSNLKGRIGATPTNGRAWGIKMMPPTPVSLGKRPQQSPNARSKSRQHGGGAGQAQRGHLWEIHPRVLALEMASESSLDVYGVVTVRLRAWRRPSALFSSASEHRHLILTWTLVPLSATRGVPIDVGMIG